MGQDIAITQSLEITEARPDFLKKDGPARGNENVGTQDVVLPRIEVIQSLSPQRKTGDPKHIEGANDGDMFNSLTGDLYKGQVAFVPVYFGKVWNVWKHRKSGGGFRGQFQTQQEAEDFIATQPEAGKTVQGNKGPEPELAAVETAVHIILLFGEAGVEEVSLSLSKTKLKVSRALNSLVRLAGGDRFSRVYALSSVVEKNGVGETYQNFAVKSLGYPSAEVYNRAEALFNAITGGTKKFTVDQSGDDAGDDDGKKAF